MSLGRKIVLVICLIVFVGSAGVLIDYFLNGMRERTRSRVSRICRTGREDLVTDKGTVIGKYADLYLTNSDIIGWIKIEDTKVDYPVMQTKDDPEFYLHRGFSKEYTGSGSAVHGCGERHIHTDFKFPDLRTSHEERHDVP